MAHFTFLPSVTRIPWRPIFTWHAHQARLASFTYKDTQTQRLGLSTNSDPQLQLSLTAATALGLQDGEDHNPQGLLCPISHPQWLQSLKKRISTAT